MLEIFSAVVNIALIAIMLLNTRSNLADMRSKKLLMKSLDKEIQVQNEHKEAILELIALIKAGDVKAITYSDE